MNSISAFTQLEGALGREHALAVAQYVEDGHQKKLDDLVTRSDLKQELTLLRKEAVEQKLEVLDALRRIEVNIAEQENKQAYRLMQWSVIQLVATIAALIALSKLL